MVEPFVLKLNNKFKVSDLLDAIEIDFLYSYNVSDRVYLLLNDDLYGEINVEVIHQQIENGTKVVIIEIPTNVLKAYNIDEQEIIDVFLNIGEL